MELMEILLPVIDPVLILCLGSFNGCRTDIDAPASDLLQTFFYCFEHSSIVSIWFQVKTDLCHTVICRAFRENVHKHLGLVTLT